jgi:hypothetical protein
MVSARGMTAFGKAYLWAVIAAGFAVISASIYQLVTWPISSQWFILAALTLISGSATVRIPRLPPRSRSQKRSSLLRYCSTAPQPEPSLSRLTGSSSP